MSMHSNLRIGKSSPFEEYKLEVYDMNAAKTIALGGNVRRYKTNLLLVKLHTS